jgi:hypothetical protein
MLGGPLKSPPNPYYGENIRDPEDNIIEIYAEYQARSVIPGHTTAPREARRSGATRNDKVTPRLPNV